jgi:hypothetical protein
MLNMTKTMGSAFGGGLGGWGRIVAWGEKTLKLLDNVSLSTRQRSVKAKGKDRMTERNLYPINILSPAEGRAN